MPLGGHTSHSKQVLNIRIILCLFFYNQTKQNKTKFQDCSDLLHDQAVAHGALLALVRGSVVEVVHLAFVTLVAHEALAAVAGTITATLHGDGAHRVAVTSWRR